MNSRECAAGKTIVFLQDAKRYYKALRDIVDRLNAAIEWVVQSEMEIVYIQHNNLSAGTRTFKPETKGAELVPVL